MTFKWIGGIYIHSFTSTVQWIELDSGVPQGSILGPLLFIIFINGINEGIVSDILKFADDTKLFGEVGSNESRDRLKEDLSVVWMVRHMANEIQYWQM